MKVGRAEAGVSDSGCNKTWETIEKCDTIWLSSGQKADKGLGVWVKKACPCQERWRWCNPGSALVHIQAGKHP